MKRVKIFIDEGRETVEKPVWHLVQDFADAKRALCSGEVYGMGEGWIEEIGVDYIEKDVTGRGQITCPRCIEQIKFYKSVPI